MTITNRRYTVPTVHGVIAVEESGRDSGLPLFMIHGNSFCRDVFRYQLHSPLAEKYRLIALDLPGMGESGYAPDPMWSYTRFGFSDAVIKVLEHLRIKETVVLGWSLGGHVAIDVLAKFPGVRGLMLTGSPPVPIDDMAIGFKGSPHTKAAGKEVVTEKEIEEFIQAIFGKSAEPFMYEAVRSADGRFRKRVFESARDRAGVDQRVTVESASVPIAVVNGADDAIINLDYFDTVNFADLWEGQCYRLPGVGHAPFWAVPEKFNPLLERFLEYTGAGK